MFFNKDKKKIEGIDDLAESLKRLSDKLDEIEKEIEEIKKENKKKIKSCGIVRFNPFPGMGGNQSFSLAMLDENKDGALITSLYSLKGSTVYGKKINNGESENSLLPEEIEAIKEALKEKQEATKKAKTKKNGKR